MKYGLPGLDVLWNMESREALHFVVVSVLLTLLRVRLMFRFVLVYGVNTFSVKMMQL